MSEFWTGFWAGIITALMPGLLMVALMITLGWRDVEDNYQRESDHDC